MEFEFDKEVKNTSKTLRRVGWNWNSNKNIVIESTNRKRLQCEFSTEYSVTDVDSYFCEAFVRRDKQQYGFSTSLNCPERWNEVVQHLEERSITCAKKFDKGRGQIVKVFEMPVTGQIVVPKPKVNKREAIDPQKHWVCFNGTFYDPAFIYEYEAHKLKKVCPRISPLPHFGEGKIVEMAYRSIRHGQRDNRRRNFSINHKGFHASGAGWEQNGKHKHMTIDLGKEEYVTHIGTAGQFPHTYVWNQDEYEPRLGKMRKTLHLTSQISRAFVTSFNLSYFNSASRVWVEVGVFTANVDAVTEVVTAVPQVHFSHDKGLLARYLRIEPLSHFNAPVLRVSAYGIKYLKESKLKLEQEVVTYTLYEPSARIGAKAIGDYAYKSHRKDDYWYSKVVQPRHRMISEAIAADADDNASDAVTADAGGGGGGGGSDSDWNYSCWNAGHGFFHVLPVHALHIVEQHDPHDDQEWCSPRGGHGSEQDPDSLSCDGRSSEAVNADIANYLSGLGFVNECLIDCSRDDAAGAAEAEAKAIEESMTTPSDGSSIGEDANFPHKYRAATVATEFLSIHGAASTRTESICDAHAPVVTADANIWPCLSSSKEVPPIPLYNCWQRSSARSRAGAGAGAGPTGVDVMAPLAVPHQCPLNNDHDRDGDRHWDLIDDDAHHCVCSSPLASLYSWEMIEADRCNEVDKVDEKFGKDGEDVSRPLVQANPPIGDQQEDNDNEEEEDGDEEEEEEEEWDMCKGSAATHLATPVLAAIVTPQGHVTGASGEAATKDAADCIIG